MTPVRQLTLASAVLRQTQVPGSGSAEPTPVTSTWDVEIPDTGSLKRKTCGLLHQLSETTGVALSSVRTRTARRRVWESLARPSVAFTQSRAVAIGR